MLNWPTAIALILSLGMIYGMVSDWIDRKRPRPTHCVRCLRELGEDMIQKHQERVED